MSGSVYINQIACAVPEFEIHTHFLEHMDQLFCDEKMVRTLKIMAARSGIDTRYSVLTHPIAIAGKEGFYNREKFPSTLERMSMYEKKQGDLIDKALLQIFPLVRADSITHVIFATCTGFHAPGPEIGIIRRWGLREDVKRLQIGFMGCFSALIGLRQASEIIRSNQDSRVLLVNLEACTLHLQNLQNLEAMTPSLLFGDGCSAAVLSSDPSGIKLSNFYSELIMAGIEDMSWRVSDQGFVMHLSPGVGPLIEEFIKKKSGLWRKDQYSSFAIHPGGKRILLAVKNGLNLSDQDLSYSQEVLKNYGNMSSATVMFVLQKIMKERVLGPGISMAFGPGLSVEAMEYEYQ